MKASFTCPTLTGILPVTLHNRHVSSDQIHPCIELNTHKPKILTKVCLLDIVILIDKQCQDLLAQEISAVLFSVSFLLPWPQGVIYIPSFSLSSIQNNFPMEEETLNENFLDAQNAMVFDQSLAAGWLVGWLTGTQSIHRFNLMNHSPLPSTILFVVFTPLSAASS